MRLVMREVTRSPKTSEGKNPYNPRCGLLNQSSRVRSTTSPAALPATIGDGSRLTDELECPAIREFSSALYAQLSGVIDGDAVDTDLKILNSLRTGCGRYLFLLYCWCSMPFGRTRHIIFPSTLLAVDLGPSASSCGHIKLRNYALGHQ